MRKKVEGKEVYRNYGLVVIAFLVVMTVSILIFFDVIRENVNSNTRNSLSNYAGRQCFHLQSILEVQYEYMEGLASYIGLQEELTDEASMNLIRSVQKESYLEAVGIVDENGISTYDTGEQKDVSERAYFQQAMKGERTLSDPLVSKLSGEQRVILGVPIYQGGEVKGVLGGSYDLAYLGSLVFEDLYDGKGFQFLVTPGGEVISLDHSEDEIVNPIKTMISTEDNFYERCQRVNFIEKKNADDIRTDFEDQASGITRFQEEGVTYYLTYAPISMNNWMLCYVVPRAAAQEPYSFIEKDELILACALILAVVILFLVLASMNSRRQKTLIYYAENDELTGIFNRRAFEHKVRSWMDSEECTGKQAFLMMDVDLFKEINDVYGHAVGDKVLKQVGKILRETFRGSDILGRIGGDEFMVFMKDITEKELAARKAEKLKEKLLEIDFPELKGRKITASMGIAFFPDAGESYKEVYICADKALYEAKRSGRNGYHIYHS